MSRARPIQNEWFDTKVNYKPAKTRHLELLASVENLSLDDLLDEGLTQGQVITRLREGLGEGIVPPEVLERKRQQKEQAPARCVICEMEGWVCEGGITRHHFIPRWLMRELENYNAYSARPTCTIPICVARHRDLHYRDANTDKSIVKYLSPKHRELAQKMLDDLKEQRPKIFDLIAGGSIRSYEYQLLRDYQTGAFRVSIQEIEGVDQEAQAS